MADPRKKLQNDLYSYTINTLSYILTVKIFCENSSEWILWREKKLNLMKDINNRMKNMFTPVEELEKELTEVLKDTLEGLDKLDCFLDAVEKLAVTSLHVFMENEMLRLSDDVTLNDLQAVLRATASISPLLLEFKYDNENLFLPKLKHMEFLICRLDKYIQTIKTICEKLETSCSCDFSLKKTNNIKVNVHKGLSKDYIQKMLDHINLLDEIRMDQHFRLVFLFQQKKGQHFVKMFTEQQPRMLEFLQQLEDTAVQLNRMHTGAKISSVAGSSVGLVGGVTSIVGLALMPVTFGVSLALTMTGAGLGIASGVNSVVTTATEIGVNTAQLKKAGELFQNFMEDVQKLQDCIDQVISLMAERMTAAQVEAAVGVGRAVCTGGAATAIRLLKPKEVVTSVGKAVAQEGKLGQSISRMASDVPDIGQVATKSSLALTKSARVGLIAVNALFVGLDIFIICKDSISLAKGSESEAAQFISERVALWRSMMGSWQKIHESLAKGLPAAEKKEAVLSAPFYMSMKIKDPTNEEPTENVEGNLANSQ
ncbi:apolipoprotein L2-like isoform X2 [Gouania willdenowi]|uniref:apolipoprotein L2-like isoform X2 n=1 Tax=Gouania willdenowi TaxID=441366 RepID=UPI001056D742|nr:apolipoprotein L2-like isoform X2 [Gouania willdenowi]